MVGSSSQSFTQSQRSDKTPAIYKTLCSFLTAAFSSFIMSGKVLLILLGVFCLAIYETSASDADMDTPTNSTVTDPEDVEEAEVISEEGKNVFFISCRHAINRKSSRKEFIGDSLNSSAINQVCYLSQTLAMDHS